MTNQNITIVKRNDTDKKVTLQFKKGFLNNASMLLNQIVKNSLRDITIYITKKDIIFGKTGHYIIIKHGLNIKGLFNFVYNKELMNSKEGYIIEYKADSNLEYCPSGFNNAIIKSITLNANDLLNDIKKHYFSISTDKLRPAMCNLLFDIEDMHIVSTDAHVLTCSSFNPLDCLNGTKKLVLPDDLIKNKSLGKKLNSLNNTTTTDICIKQSGTHTIMEYGDVTIFYPINGEQHNASYPDYKSVVAVDPMKRLSDSTKLTFSSLFIKEIINTSKEAQAKSKYYKEEKEFLYVLLHVLENKIKLTFGFGSVKLHTIIYDIPTKKADIGIVAKFSFNYLISYFKSVGESDVHVMIQKQDTKEINTGVYFVMEDSPKTPWDFTLMMPIML